MWSSSRNDNLKKGFVLPLTLILLTFGSIMVFVAGLHVSRTTDKIQSYNIIANQQNVAANVVEAASYIYFKDQLEPNTTCEWEGLEEFKNYVSARGGVEGDYWNQTLDTLDAESPCLKIDMNAYQTLPSFGEGNYDIEAILYNIGDKKIIIGIAKRNGRKRFSLGVLANIATPSIPAVRLGSLTRDLAKMHVISKTKVNGDLILGKAIILDDVFLDITDQSTPGEIIYPSLEASWVTIDGGDIEDYPNWFTATSTENKSEIIEGWKEEHLSSLPQATRTIYLNDTDSWPESFNGDTLYIIDATSTTESSTNNFYVDFITNEISNDVFEGEMHITQIKDIYGTDEDSNSIGEKLIIPEIVDDSSKVHVQINGNIAIGEDSKRIVEVCGKYSLTVYGDIIVNSSIAYHDVYGDINNGNGNSTVGNHPLTLKKSEYTDMMGINNHDALDLVSIGGDIEMLYQKTSTHGVKALTGNIMAFEDGGTGGDISFPDLVSAVNDLGRGVTSQFFVFGSLTANTFDEGNNLVYEDQVKNKTVELNAIDSITLIANSLENNLSGSNSGELQLLGMRTW